MLETRSAGLEDNEKLARWSAWPAVSGEGA